MTAKDIAQILLSRQNASYSFILDGATRTKLTHEGFQYAMQRGWIELDEATSCMRISMRAAKLEEIKLAATAEVGEPLSSPASSLTSVGHDLAFGHATEIEKSTSSEVVSEHAKLTPPVVITPGNESWRQFIPFEGAATASHDLLIEYGPPTAQPPQPPQPATPTAAGKDDFEVGDPVIMAEDGKTYQATVQSKQADGSVVLSFGTDKPSKIKPSYARNEIQRAPTAAGKTPAKPSTPTPTASTPAIPSPAMPSGPAAPGIGRR
jgi:hypothetical protein